MDLKNTQELKNLIEKFLNKTQSALFKQIDRAKPSTKIKAKDTIDRIVMYEFPLEDDYKKSLNSFLMRHYLSKAEAIYESKKMMIELLYDKYIKIKNIKDY